MKNKLTISIVIAIFFISGNIFALKNFSSLENLCKTHYLCFNYFLEDKNFLPENEDKKEIEEKQKINLEKINKILNIIEKKGYESEKLNDNKKLEDNILKGVVATLGDPFSSYMPAKQTEDFKEEMAGNFEGIGAELQTKDGMIIITSPLKGSPAIKAGLMPKDIILKVDGEDILGQNLSDVVKKIRGPKGTEVVLTVFRKNEEEKFGKEIDIKIIRDTIHINSVKYELKKSPKGENVGYISINQFGDKTIEEFYTGLQQAEKDDVKYLILDLRFNGGGYLDGAVWIASPFLEKGALITTIKSKEGNKELRSIPFGKGFPNLPMAVLINGGSASASEIVSGALRDHEKAILVGEKSFGKGSVQTLVPFDDGSNLKLTIAKWFTPNDQDIHQVGINPDVKIGKTFDDMVAKKDPQLDKAIEILENGNLKQFFEEKKFLTGSAVMKFNSSGILVTDLDKKEKEKEKIEKIKEEIFGNEEKK
ncbi:S41 family peptidase [Candidatus Gracilibacteria bacterium]|nr:S41 family peptidase [Candidatus Gracilibacteria bacterium]